MFTALDFVRTVLSLVGPMFHACSNGGSTGKHSAADFGTLDNMWRAWKRPCLTCRGN